MDVRIWRDVLPYNPTVVTVMLGMNDGRYRAFDQAIFDEFTTGYKHIVDTVKRQLPGVRITLIQPSPYDDVTRAPMFEGGYNQVLVRYGDFLKQLAAEQKLGLADFNTSVVAALAKANAADAASAAKLIPDRVHPGRRRTPDHGRSAASSAWNAPALVTGVEIDAARKEAVRQRNTHVTDLHTGKRSLLDPDRRRASHAASICATRWSRWPSARPTSSKRSISSRSTCAACPRDDTPEDRRRTAGTFTAEQLAAGINLAKLPTPMARQAAEVHALTLRHNNVHATRWRQVQVPLEKDHSPHLSKALDALDDLEADLLKEQRAAAIPKARHFELSPE